MEARGRPFVEAIRASGLLQSIRHPSWTRRNKLSIFAKLTKAGHNFRDHRDRVEIYQPLITPTKGPVHARSADEGKVMKKGGITEESAA